MQRAVEVSVLIVRAFVRTRSALTANIGLASRVDELAREVERQSGKLTTHDAAILKLLAEIRRLTQFPAPARPGIGFTAAWPNGMSLCAPHSRMDWAQAVDRSVVHANAYVVP
jgi:hypothetical protein